ncbi:MAG TPA: deoxyribodipyrimidine photolyase [Planctomycetota bacterium]|nr:deoxyribodipyrimidine photolyase [Planctomycetota bacterium]
MTVPEVRIRAMSSRPLREEGAYVLYWMIASRRLTSNFALDRAVALARSLGKPLVILEPLRCGYRWASDRIHAFVLDGMRENASTLVESPVRHYAYVEPEPGAGRGLLRALAERACVVVTDDFPGFFLPRMVEAAARQLPVRLETVDSNGILPLRVAMKVYNTAHEFRRFLQKTLPEHLDVFPRRDPFKGTRLEPAEPFPRAILARWKPASPALLAREPAALAKLPIDHSVAPVPGVEGGAQAALARLRAFLATRLRRYAEERNEPDEDVTSGLSPYLHFGHIAAHRVFEDLMRRERWTRDDVAPKATGSRSGWWGASPAAEAFLDQLVTWRELGFNMSSKRPDELDRYEALPTWARTTLEEHARDERPSVYTRAELEAARTHDPLWNAAQTQLVREGTIHNYLRMLWGKKVLEWSRSPREALETLIHLNDRYALDGRDPNSVSGIFWCLGRYDRAWGPERPIFGKVRYMSSANTARKLHVTRYLARHGSA